MNYNLLMEEELQKLSSKKNLLLHACCAPCSTEVLERLMPYFEITILYYNPNITESEEYQKRLEEMINFAKIKGIEVIEGEYCPSAFLKLVEPVKDLKEGSKRCYLCYQHRLLYTAKYAHENNFDYFTTTLSISPYKNANWLNEIGSQLSKTFNISYLYADFKKKDGYKHSIKLAKEYDLYRQDYCGCLYSKKENEAKHLLNQKEE
ncbi:MAG: epoxyqueuosine reductase QueH [Bacilli bacterium]